MKILMLNHEFPPVGGGASPVTYELCSRLSAMGHKVDVVTMRYRTLPRSEQVEGFRVFRTPAIRLRPDICTPLELATYAPGAMMKTLRLVRNENYDVIHCHFMVPGALLAYPVSKISGVPLLITCHGSDVPGYNPDRFGLLHKIIAPAWRLLVRRIPLITVPGESLKTLILQKEPEANVVVVPNGIFPDACKPVIKKKRILLCSRLLKRKGIQYALEAIKTLTLDWDVDVIGDGPYLPELRHIAEGSQTPIKFHGWLDKKDPQFVSLFAESSIFIFTSEAESFGMVVAEAMAAGSAVIASDIPAHKELLGNAGLFVGPANAGQIRTQLQRLIGDASLRMDLQKRARERVCAKFSWNVVAHQYVDAYEQAIHESK